MYYIHTRARARAIWLREILGPKFKKVELETLEIDFVKLSIHVTVHKVSNEFV